MFKEGTIMSMKLVTALLATLVVVQIDAAATLTVESAVKHHATAVKNAAQAGGSAYVELPPAPFQIAAFKCMMCHDHGDESARAVPLPVDRACEGAVHDICTKCIKDLPQHEQSCGYCNTHDMQTAKKEKEDCVVVMPADQAPIIKTQTARKSWCSNIDWAHEFTTAGLGMLGGSLITGVRYVGTSLFTGLSLQKTFSGGNSLNDVLITLGAYAFVRYKTSLVVTRSLLEPHKLRHGRERA